MTNNSALEITNLMFTYNEQIDAGNFEAAAALFIHAKLRLITVDHLGNDKDFLAMLRQVIKIYPDGTPRTKHLVTNPIIELDEENGKATGRCQYTVFQATDQLPFQAIAGGRYHDQFEWVDGKWRFSYRDFTLLDFKGNLDEHLNLTKV